MEIINEYVITRIGNSVFDFVVHYGSKGGGYLVVFFGNEEECEEFIRMKKEGK